MTQHVAHRGSDPKPEIDEKTGKPKYCEDCQSKKWCDDHNTCAQEHEALAGAT